MVVDETGGSHGIRDHNIILSLENTPNQQVFGKELYPTVFLKAAVYIRNIIMNHPFIDGNKRTGMTSAGVFLEDNGYIITVKEGGIEEFSLRVIDEKLDLNVIAIWLKKHSRKIKSK
ncbi:MAG: type II toxin-antitoxin system death-on-curing family toxin [Candidatus Zambryskibacteria bacterium]|nr:type II toxin-antitoxin system death-on-curing family toxin [Candidatus Zambryskibacteria bacterium]